MAPTRKAKSHDTMSFSISDPSTSTSHQNSASRAKRSLHKAHMPSLSLNALPGVQKLKASLRQTRRLLAKDKLAADVRVETERRLKALEADLAQAERAKQERTMASGTTRSKKERKKLEARLLELRVDLNYVLHYPKTKKYISLLPPDVRHAQDTPAPTHTESKEKLKTDAHREEVRRWVREQMEQGTFSDEPEVELETENGRGARALKVEADEKSHGEMRNRAVAEKKADAVMRWTKIDTSSESALPCDSLIHMFLDFGFFWSLKVFYVSLSPTMRMSFGKVIPLATGASIPQIGLGTWLSKPNEVENAVEIAIRNGYRHIDCAMIYENQDEVSTFELVSSFLLTTFAGRSCAEESDPSVVKREELFITSKLWNNSHKAELVEKELDATLSQLGLDYLDLYLVHWPVAFASGGALQPPDPEKEGWVKLDTETPLVETWKAMIELPKTGKVKAIGVSNFTIEHIKGIVEATGVWPVVNQVEAHPLLLHEDLVAFCKEHNIHLTAYSPLGNNMVGQKRLTEYPRSLRSHRSSRGFSVIPKSVQEERIVSNFKQVELSDEDFARITELGHKNPTRFNMPFTYPPKWDINIFGDKAEQGAMHKIRIV
ncbi:Aldehyde reductase 1 [Grifola frondosa]|uniref:Aldehyde reductase 1 n=1 Tax=Grifola frondosa TaxID=5627 RepID=A0A1C7M040_GRIFR|nr:Aldehyde reductase 1 [Grifola frondosa]